jgi:phosphoribosylformylglycinamidine synthase
MAQSAFDEAVRALVSVGARLPRDASGPFEAFAGCDNFCVPDSVFHPERNPDGREKLGKLVRIAEGLADMVRAFEIPMISGKDSMKNDFRSGGRKISVPPTLLVTMVAKVRDVRRLVTSEWKAEGDVVYLLGETYDELGRSIVAELRADLGGTAPRVRIPETIALYGLMARGHDAGLFASSHDLSDGGLAVALAESCIGSGLGADLSLPASGISAYAALFAESNARFLVSVRPNDVAALEALFGPRATRLGLVGGERLCVAASGAPVVDLSVTSLADAYETRLS